VVDPLRPREKVARPLAGSPNREPAVGASGPSAVEATVYSAMSTPGSTTRIVSVRASVSSRTISLINKTIVAKSHTRPTIDVQSLILTIVFITHGCEAARQGAERIESLAGVLVSTPKFATLAPL